MECRQILGLRGIPKSGDVEGKEAWSIYYLDGSFRTAPEQIDSALLTIARGD